MSLRSYAMAWEGSEASGGELLVLLAIVEHYNREAGYAWPSVETIARYARVKSLRTVQKHIRSLEERGEIKVAMGGGRQNPNRYYVNFQKLRTRAEERNRAHENPAEFAGFWAAGKNGEVFKKTPQSEGAGRHKPRNSGAAIDAKPRNSDTETPQIRGTELRGKVEEPLEPLKEREEADPAAPPDSLSPDLDGVGGRSIGQWRMLWERLAQVWPAAGDFSQVEVSALIGPDGSALWSTSAELWLAWRVWTREAPDKVRGRTLWPRSRREALVPSSRAPEPVADWTEQVLSWWHKKGRAWWKHHQRKNAPREVVEDLPPNDFLEWLETAGLDTGEAKEAWKARRYAREYNAWVQAEVVGGALSSANASVEAAPNTKNDE